MRDNAGEKCLVTGECGLLELGRAELSGINNCRNMDLASL